MEIKDLEKVDWSKVKEIFTPDKESFLEKAKKEWERYPAAHEALKIAAAFGVISLVVLMPGLGKILASELRNAEKQRYKRLWKGFVKQKLVSIKETAEGSVVEITEAGLKRALKYKISEMKIKKPSSWDGLWRIVIFDVSEFKHRSRDDFRENIKCLGFYRLNQSVFVYPYPCFDEVEFLRQISGIGREVSYITAQSIETQIDLKNHFNLQP